MVRPFRVVARKDPDLKVYFPEECPIQVHQLRVYPCPSKLPAGFYWYGGQRKSPGHVPPWLQKLLSVSTGEGQDIPMEGTGEAELDEEESREQNEPPHGEAKRTGR